MNGLEEVQGSIKNFIYEKEQVQKQITEIEQRRIKLAQERNEKKRLNANNPEVSELGKTISKLGNQSQELQNKLDSNLYEVKTELNLIIDNLVAEGIRKIRKINEEIKSLENNIGLQNERNTRYELQRQEFYVRFGRMPELSENAIKENKIQKEEAKKNALEIKNLEGQVDDIENEITVLAVAKRKLKNGNWNFLIEAENEKVEEVEIEPLNIDEIEPIEELFVEEFDEIEELYIGEFDGIEELNVEEFNAIEESDTMEELYIEEFETTEGTNVETIASEEKTDSIDEIEELAKSIVEEIVTEQAKDINTGIIEEKNVENDFIEDIISFEEESKKKEKVIIPLFGQKATISNIIVKIENGELVYKAQMSDEEEIKIYPARLGEESVLLRDKQNREECKEILFNYAICKCKTYDKNVISKIDPLVCELLIECAEQYNYDAEYLIYNYIMSFSKCRDEDVEIEAVPDIMYNLSYIETSNLSRKEKTIIRKICKNASKNNKIDIIESFTGVKKIKYLFKRLFAVNNVNVLPEGKY